MKTYMNNSKHVKLQYTFVNNDDNNNEIIVYSFNKDVINSVIKAEITCANYRLGQVMNDIFLFFMQVALQESLYASVYWNILMNMEVFQMHISTI